MTPHGKADFTVLHCVGSVSAAFAKSLWFLVIDSDINNDDG